MFLSFPKIVIPLQLFVEKDMGMTKFPMFKVFSSFSIFLFIALNWYHLQLVLLNTWSRLLRHWTLQYVSIFWKVLFRCVILPIRMWFLHFIYSYTKSGNGGKWDKIFVIDCPFDSRKEEHSRNNKTFIRR